MIVARIVHCSPTAEATGRIIRISFRIQQIIRNVTFLFLCTWSHTSLRSECRLDVIHSLHEFILSSHFQLFLALPYTIELHPWSPTLAGTYRTKGRDDSGLEVLCPFQHVLRCCTRTRMGMDSIAGVGEQILRGGSGKGSDISLRKERWFNGHKDADAEGAMQDPTALAVADGNTIVFQVITSSQDITA